jgi:predicted MFS family arabinose efflux permease
MWSRLWALTLGSFAIGTGALIVPGMLNELSADLAVSPARVGLLIAAFAVTVCFAGPPLAGLTSRIERRTLLSATLAFYALMHFAAALAPEYFTLLLTRMAAALATALFTPQAAATAGLMVTPKERGQAIGLTFLGWSISAVLGTPLGAYLSANVGWRPTMALVGVVSAIAAAALWLRVPARLHVAPVDRAAWKGLFTNTPMLLALAVTAIQALGMFTVFSYMALLLKDTLGATPAGISALFLGFGIAGVIGNLIGARMMDKAGPVKVGAVAMSCMCVALAMWSFTNGSMMIGAVLTVVWGLGFFAVNSAQQVRLVAMGPSLASASVAINSSAFYLGQGAGAFMGSVIVAWLGIGKLALFGAVPMALAVVVSLYAARLWSRQEARTE